MSLLDDILKKLGLGAIYDRAHLFSFDKVSAPGVVPRFTRDLHPLPETGLSGGHLLELYAILDERHDIPGADAKIRFDVLEEDFLLAGGLDDRIVSLLGTGADPPEAGAPTRQLTTQIHELPDEYDVASYVEEHKRTTVAYEDTILVITQTPDPLAGRPHTKRTHVIGWLRAEHVDDIGAHSESYFVLDIAGVVRAASPVLELTAAPPGVSVRVRGVLDDASPLDAATPEPLSDIRVTLAGRRATTGAGGQFVLDARLDVGDHDLVVSRSGIEPVTLTVRVAADPQGVVTASVLDAQGQELVSGKTAAAATEASVVALALPNPIAVVAHKLRGTVRWPDSRPGDVPADYQGTPLAERRVYVLPVPDGTVFADVRPKTSRAWEELKRRPEVLRSSRPGRPGQQERTDSTGRFEIRYVDFTAGKRFLIWVERFDPQDAGDTLTESPDFVVRTFQGELIQLDGPVANQILSINRLIVDQRYGAFSGDCVPLGVEALRVTDFRAPRGRTLVRPQQATRGGVTPSAATRTDFETRDPLLVGTGDNLDVPDSRVVGAIAAAGAPVVGGLDLFVLPLVPLYESADNQGGAAERAAAALQATSAGVFVDYADTDGTMRRVAYDAGGVRLALDTSRLGRGQAIDLDGGHWDPVDADDDAKAVKQLEATLVERDQARVAPEQARWHIDVTSLADEAFVHLRGHAAGGATASDRALIGTVHPVLQPVSPLLPGLASRHVYLGPGHGLFPSMPVVPGNLPPAAKAAAEAAAAAVYTAHAASTNPQDWASNRGGWDANAGEDEVDNLLAGSLARLLRRCAALVATSREIFSYDALGIVEPNHGVFATVADPAPPNLPVFLRRWQQNAYFHLGQAGAAIGNAGNFKGDDAGIRARTENVRSFATAGTVDLFLALHTDSFDTKTRGTTVEYLNVATAAGIEGNPLGLAFGRRLSARLLERLRTGTRGVRTMNLLNTFVVGDLAGTFDHWRDGVGPGISQHRQDTAHAGWVHEPFPPGNTVAPFTNWLRIPVALTEHSFHDNPDDAALLSRAWFRRLAAEGSAQAIDAQLQTDPAPVSNVYVKAVLRRTFGDTDVLRNRPDAGVATAATIGDAVRAVGDPLAADPATADRAAVAGAALAAARALTRQGLVDLIRESVRTTAGWEAGDLQTTIDSWVSRAITSGGPLERPSDPVTRDDAAVFACAAVGRTPRSLVTAETAGPGNPAPPPLMRRAAVRADESAFFGRIEANALLAQLATLQAKDIHTVNDAFLVDGSWTRLGSGPTRDSYELDRGTPVTVLVRTSGVPWKTLNQNGTNGGAQDVEIIVSSGGRQISSLTCATRTTLLVASSTWFVDLPPSAAPAELTLELWVHHRTAGRLLVGSKRLTLLVRPLPAA